MDRGFGYDYEKHKHKDKYMHTTHPNTPKFSNTQILSHIDERSVQNIDVSQGHHHTMLILTKKDSPVKELYFSGTNGCSQTGLGSNGEPFPQGAFIKSELPEGFVLEKGAAQGNFSYIYGHVQDQKRLYIRGQITDVYTHEPWKQIKWGSCELSNVFVGSSAVFLILKSRSIVRVYASGKNDQGQLGINEDSIRTYTYRKVMVPFEPKKIIVQDSYTLFLSDTAVYVSGKAPGLKCSYAPVKIDLPPESQILDALCTSNGIFISFLGSDQKKHLFAVGYHSCDELGITRDLSIGNAGNSGMVILPNDFELEKVIGRNKYVAILGKLNGQKHILINYYMIRDEECVLIKHTRHFTPLILPDEFALDDAFINSNGQLHIKGKSYDGLSNVYYLHNISDYHLSELRHTFNSPFLQLNLPEGLTLRKMFSYEGRSFLDSSDILLMESLQGGEQILFASGGNSCGKLGVGVDSSNNYKRVLIHYDKIHQLYWQFLYGEVSDLMRFLNRSSSHLNFSQVAVDGFNALRHRMRNFSKAQLMALQTAYLYFWITYKNQVQFDWGNFGMFIKTRIKSEIRKNQSQVYDKIENDVHMIRLGSFEYIKNNNDLHLYINFFIERQDLFIARIESMCRDRIQQISNFRPDDELIPLNERKLISFRGLVSQLNSEAEKIKKIPIDTDCVNSVKNILLNLIKAKKTEIFGLCEGLNCQNGSSAVLTAAPAASMGSEFEVPEAPRGFHAPEGRSEAGFPLLPSPRPLPKFYSLTEEVSAARMVPRILERIARGKARRKAIREAREAAWREARRRARPAVSAARSAVSAAMSVARSAALPAASLTAPVAIPVARPISPVARSAARSEAVGVSVVPVSMVSEGTVGCLTSENSKKRQRSSSIGSPSAANCKRPRNEGDDEYPDLYYDLLNEELHEIEGEGLPESLNPATIFDESDDSECESPCYSGHKVW